MGVSRRGVAGWPSLPWQVSSRHPLGPAHEKHPRVSPSPDDRAPLAIAADWATVAITVSLEMAVPALMGYGLDYLLGTRVVFVAIGAILGLVVGMMHLVRLANAKPGDRGKKPPRT